MGDSFIDQNHFRRVLNRNVAVPLGFGFLSAFFFSVIVYFLLNVSHWVERSVLGVSYAHEMLKEIGELEASMRGYLIAGDEVFLQPYRTNLPAFAEQLRNLEGYASDDPVQRGRIARVEQLHDQWVDFAEQAIALRAKNEPVVDYVRSRRGLELKEEQRQLLNQFIAYERQVRGERTDTAEMISTVLIGGFLLFSLIFSGLLGFFGRRDLLSLSESYAESLARQQAHAQALEKQAWYRTGQTQLSESMIGEQALPTLGQNVLSFLSRYLDVAVVDGVLSMMALAVDEFLATGTVPGPEGTEMLATTVFPDDPKRSLQFVWWNEEKLSDPSYIELPAKLAAPGGVHIGQSLAEVEALNGQPFTLLGFGWDYGGSAGFETGALSDLPGDCLLSVRFEYGESPEGLDTLPAMGDKELSSDDPLLAQMQVRLYAVSIGYPHPDFRD